MKSNKNNNNEIKHCAEIESGPFVTNLSVLECVCAAAAAESTICIEIERINDFSLKQETIIELSPQCNHNNHKMSQ